jgi:hypothetical protein
MQILLSMLLNSFFLLSKLMKLLLLNKISDGTQNQRAKDPILSLRKPPKKFLFPFS